MYLLDTNVVSELRKVIAGRGNPGVESWAKAVDAGQLFISSIVALELERGVLQIERRDLRQGKILRHWLEKQVLPEFDGRVLGVDLKVALLCAKLHHPNPRPDRDAFIAATALAHRLVVVTRNTKDFQGCGVELLNPWLGGKK